jgi:hypothetical protein
MPVAMIDTGELIRRNATFASGRSFVGLSIRPGENLRVIGCVDPSDVLGLKLGEATVIRNVGGRVTPATLRTLAMLAKISQVNSDGRPVGDSHPPPSASTSTSSRTGSPPESSSQDSSTTRPRGSSRQLSRPRG